MVQMTLWLLHSSIFSFFKLIVFILSSTFIALIHSHQSCFQLQEAAALCEKKKTLRNDCIFPARHLTVKRRERWHSGAFSTKETNLSSLIQKDWDQNIHRCRCLKCFLVSEPSVASPPSGNVIIEWIRLVKWTQNEKYASGQSGLAAICNSCWKILMCHHVTDV